MTIKPRYRVMTKMVSKLPPVLKEVAITLPAAMATFTSTLS